MYGKGGYVQNTNECWPPQRLNSTLSVFTGTPIAKCFLFRLILILYSNQISDFPFLFPFPFLAHFPSISHFALAFFSSCFLSFGLMLCHFLGVTWCFGVWFFCILFAFVAFGQLANFSIASTEAAEESERFSWCFWVAVFVVGSAKMLHKTVEIMIVLLIESVCLVIGQFSKNVIHMRLSN